LSKIKYTEEELVNLLKNKSEQAFNYLYDNYSAALFGVINRIVGSEEVAEDVMQEAFVKIWKSIDGYDTQKGRLFTWMLNIARNSGIDYLRSLQHKKELQNLKIDDSVSIINQIKTESSKVDQIGLKETVGNLKPDYKLMIDLLYFKGYTQEEVSKELEMPLGTVKTRTRAALKMLREMMQVE
jgi:RNA polymerase sigma-70 factor, ECF subfamily